MSPLMLIVFAPVIVGGIAFMALLLGAAMAGAWEAVEGRQQTRPTVARLSRPKVARQEGTHARAA